MANNITDYIAALIEADPDATVWDSEITTSIPPSKVFNDFVLAYIESYAKLFDYPAEPEVVTWEEDGFTIKELRPNPVIMAPLRWTVVRVDLENLSCTYAYSGKVLYIEELKVIPLVDGGCTLKYRKADTNTEVTQDEIEAQKALLVRIFDAFKDTIA